MHRSHFTMRDRRGSFLGVHWRSLVLNFGDFGDFDANFHEFFHHLPEQLTFSTCRGCELVSLGDFLKDNFNTLPSSALYHMVHAQ